MAQGYIKLEIDQDDLNKVKQQIREIYDIANDASLLIEKTALRKAQRIGLWTGIILLALASCQIGYHLGSWLAN
jgi:hypothetical protein